MLLLVLIHLCNGFFHVLLSVNESVQARSERERPLRKIKVRIYFLADVNLLEMFKQATSSYTESKDKENSNYGADILCLRLKDSEPHLEATQIQVLRRCIILTQTRLK